MKARPEPAGAGLVIALAAVARDLHATAAETSVEYASRTILRELDLRVVVIAMAAGATIAEHRTEHTATLHVVHGRVQVHLAGRVVEVGVGEVLPLERGLAHHVVAIAASTLVLSLAHPISEP